MAETIYLLCALASIVCAWLLIRSYGQQRIRLLLWSSLCFVGLALNSILLFVDLVLVPTAMDLSLPRTLSALVGMGLLVFGLVWDAR